MNNTWPPSVGNSWRTTTDIQTYWSAVISNIDFVRLCHRLKISESFSYSRTMIIIRERVQAGGMILIVSNILYVLIYFNHWIIIL
jgi:hypothetical protein